MTKGLTIEVTVEPVWLKEQTDLSKCAICDDMICSEMYRLWLMPYTDNVRLRGEPTGMVVCESCIGLIEQ